MEGYLLIVELDVVPGTMDPVVALSSLPVPWGLYPRLGQLLSSIGNGVGERHDPGGLGFLWNCHKMNYKESP